jgi:hypothetical protein
MLQIFPGLFCFLGHLCLVVFESHDNVSNQDHICHKSCQTAGISCVAWRRSIGILYNRITRHTTEDEIDAEEVRANGQRDHGECKAHQLPDNGAVSYMSVK